MPKSLSLKKAQSNQKNQKPITQFFKNANFPRQQDESSTQNSLLSAVATGKRKASSSEKVSSLDVLKIVDKPHVPNDAKEKVYESQEIFHNSCKKLKTQSSPRKTNGFSPTKENNENKTAAANNIANHVMKLFTSTDKSLNKYERSPHSPVLVEIENIKFDKNEVSIIEDEEEDFKNCNQHIEHVSTQQVVKKKKNSPSPRKKFNYYSPIKSPIEECTNTPQVSKLLTPKKLTQEELSPSKSGSTIKSAHFQEHDVGDVFGEDWDVNEMDEAYTETLDLSTMQRCEVISVTQHATRLEVRLKNVENKRGTCFVEGIWLDTPLVPGEIISVLAGRDSSQQYYVGNTCGILVLRPDHLVSSTSVVGGVFCKRKAVLQERWRGIDSANTAMTIGIIIHELVQKALTQNITDIVRLNSEADLIIKESLNRLYDAGLTEEEARSNIQVYLSPLAEFMRTYFDVRPPTVAPQQSKDKWNGHIDEVLDIEENLCCPQLGLKGKVDATLQVTIHDRKSRAKAIVPLELKSGKASMSAEHRGQLVLYGMMLSVQRGEDPARAVQRGLLLYLKERVELREVSCGYPERRDLVMLRNQLVQHLAAAPQHIDTEQIADIEEASLLLQQQLPEPVHHERACTNCPYLTICSIHLWHCDGPTVSENHPLSKLRNIALGHLSPLYIKYFLHWTALLKIEERGQMSTSPLHALWTDSVEKRAKRGSCAPNLRLKSAVASADRYLHEFIREAENTGSVVRAEDSLMKGPQGGEFSIVSIDGRPWIAAGVVTTANEKEIHVLLERSKKQSRVSETTNPLVELLPANFNTPMIDGDLSRRHNKSTLFHIDTYESYATTVQNLTNLGVLMEDSDRALRLRKLIIDKEDPQFEKKLPREVGRLGAKMMKSLNIQQQRAVLKALAAADYVLLQGLPGTGKTQTISVLIQMLVGLKQRVLVTAHTHSAVDTVLSRLPKSICMMRLGAEGRVSSDVAHCCEQRLATDCQTTQQLEQLYNSMEVVGVTCLGAAHAMLARTTFDVCIVDEATQVLQCTVLRPLFAAKRFVLVGDPEQLPPVVRSRAARRLGMEESLFHRLMREDATSTLQLQYRMNQALVDIANKVAYDSRLKCADEKVAHAKLGLDMQEISHRFSSAPWLSKACSPQSEYAAVFLNMKAIKVESLSKSCTNETEACVVLALVDALKEGGVQPSDIGVIAPYRDQVSLLRRSLARYAVEASTVDQFQGRDKSVIIYSCTRNDMRDDNEKIKEGEILNDQRRLAVSVTRAKHKLLVIGNSNALHRYAPLQRLIDACFPVSLDKDVVAVIVDRYKTLVA